MSVHTFLIFACIYGAMIANSFWEAYVEGRNPWDKRKLGWKLTFGEFTLPAYHFYLFFVMYPLLMILPFVIFGWNARYFGIVLSAYLSGLAVEDFGWFLVNPEVKLSEFYTPFTDYYPWFKIGKQKIVPWGYILGPLAALVSWYFLWR